MADTHRLQVLLYINVLTYQLSWLINWWYYKRSLDQTANARTFSSLTGRDEGIKRGMRKRVQERINKLTGVSCLCERIWGGGDVRLRLGGKCKILFPRINLFPRSAKWLCILSCTLPWHGQHVSVCVCFCIRERVRTTRESLKRLARREN